MLITCKNILSPYLTNIFNNIIKCSIYPDYLKISKIAHIPKTTNAMRLEDFRPIALLPAVDKEFLYQQLSSYFDECNFLYEC